VSFPRWFWSCLSLTLAEMFPISSVEISRIFLVSLCFLS
jgi:hypothetical protein